MVINDSLNDLDFVKILLSRKEIFATSVNSQYIIDDFLTTLKSIYELHRESNDVW